VIHVEVPMQRDIDLIVERLTANIPGTHIEQLNVRHPGADDDGLWFINVQDQAGQVQIESADGMCPFLIESDFSNERFHGHTVEEVIAVVIRLYART
jgi:hypothetical protein